MSKRHRSNADRISSVPSPKIPAAVLATYQLHRKVFAAAIIANASAILAARRR